MHKLVAALVLVVLTACGASGNSAASSASAPTSSLPTAASDHITTTATAEASVAPQSTTVAGTGGDLIVFAAASLTDAFTEIGQQFDAANGSTTTFNFAGSQQLAQQIVQGAPADVFASANTSQMNVVIDSGDVISGTERTFVRNRLVVIYPRDNPAGLISLGDLAKPNVGIVLAAPQVPVGQYSLDFLAKASELPQYTVAYSETVLANVVSYEENVRAVLSKITLGEADAGIVYTSDIAGDAADQVGRIDIPDELNTIATYPLAPLAASQSAELAQRFVNYVLSPDGQGVLEQYGFLPAAEGND